MDFRIDHVPRDLMRLARLGRTLERLRPPFEIIADGEYAEHPYVVVVFDSRGHIRSVHGGALEETMARALEEQGRSD